MSEQMGFLIESSYGDADVARVEGMSPQEIKAGIPVSKIFGVLESVAAYSALSQLADSSLRQIDQLLENEVDSDRFNRVLQAVEKRADGLRRYVELRAGSLVDLSITDSLYEYISSQLSALVQQFREIGEIGDEEMIQFRMGIGRVMRDCHNSIWAYLDGIAPSGGNGGYLCRYRPSIRIAGEEEEVSGILSAEGLINAIQTGRLESIERVVVHQDSIAVWERVSVLFNSQALDIFENRIRHFLFRSRCFDHGSPKIYAIPVAPEAITFPVGVDQVLLYGRGVGGSSPFFALDYRYCTSDAVQVTIEKIGHDDDCSVVEVSSVDEAAVLCEDTSNTVFVLNVPLEQDRWSQQMSIEVFRKLKESGNILFAPYFVGDSREVAKKVQSRGDMFGRVM